MGRLASFAIASLHRRLWRRLPRHWRRAALFHATALAAPRPSANARAAAPIIVAGALRTASGLGESARLCHDALKGAGLPVFGADLTAALMQPEDVWDFAFEDGRAIDGTGTIILHVNAPLVPLAMLRLGRRLVRDKRIVGYWAWELPAVPSDWRHGIPFVHEIWAPSRFTAEAIAPIAAGRPVHVAPHPVALSRTLCRASPALGARGGGGPFTVLTIFDTASSFARKNPCAAIAAFRRAFGDDPSAKLVVKTQRLSKFPKCADLIYNAKANRGNIVLIDAIMSAAGISALYGAADAIISLHRSEGFGLTLAEAMSRGLPVVATGWSGNADFLTAATGVPVGYRLVPALDPDGTYHHPGVPWAEADVQAAAAALRRLRADPALGAALGRAAAEFAARAWSREAYARNARNNLGF